VLILSAAIGEGHDLPARVLRDGIIAAVPAAAVEIRDALAEVGGLVQRLASQEAPLRQPWLRWLFDLEYRLLFRVAPVRRAVTWLGTRLSRRTIRRLVAETQPDVVVATYPGASEVLGRLRQAGELRVPVVSAITDLAALNLWAHPAVDLHLITHRESTEEVRAIAPRSRIAWVRGLTDQRFEQPLDEQSARALLGLPPSGGVVLVSGGGWGVGDIRGAVETALEAGVERVVVLCGRSDALMTELRDRFGDHPRVALLGFTDRMSDLMAAADVLVHSTAGLTVLEAWVRGCRPISYGWGIAHIRVNNTAFRRFGIAQVARDRHELRAAIQHALGAPRQPFLGYAALPAAADEVLALAANAVRPGP
jgi:UDP-N-acetylglucosamine:LPS N-acetylglucosamine transferase